MMNGLPKAGEASTIKIDDISDISAKPGGNCIMDSVLARPECPICREEITDPSLIAYIHNYE